MILILDIELFIANPEDLLEYSDIRDDIALKEQYQNTEFVIPPRILGNKNRKIYKAGFLFSFLNKLYPTKNHDEICSIMNTRYHIFLEKRQIQRCLVKYELDKNYIN